MSLRRGLGRSPAFCTLGRPKQLRRKKTGYYGDYTEFPYVTLSVSHIFRIDDSHQVALAFLNDSCASTHGNVRVDSVFLSPSGEWKLGGFEMLSNPKDDTAILYVRRLNQSIPPYSRDSGV